MKHNEQGNCGPHAVLIKSREWQTRRRGEDGWPLNNQHKEQEQQAIMKLRRAVKKKMAEHPIVQATLNTTGDLQRLLDMDKWTPTGGTTIYFGVEEMRWAADIENVQIILFMGPRLTDITYRWNLPEGANDRKKVYVFANTTPRDAEGMTGPAAQAGMRHINHWNLLVRNRKPQGHNTHRHIHIHT